MPSKVVILGGGVAGMSAAQELIERGFEVVVLERRHIAGGKARSVPVGFDTQPEVPGVQSGHQSVQQGSNKDSQHGGRHGGQQGGHQLVDDGVASIEHQLPGEHGFRFFPGFYKHVIDTMRRIPSFDGRKVADHLVPTTRVQVTQYEQPGFTVPAVFPRTPADVSTLLRDTLLALGPITGLTADDLAFFGARVWQILSSCKERRLAEYESIPWWDFVGAEQRSPAYQKFLAAGITRSLVAAKARSASTRTIGDVFVQLLLTIVNPLAGSTDRVLDGPTNLVWIDPWRAHLEAQGVQYRAECEVQQILCAGGRISGVVVRENGKTRVVQADHYLAAVPIERMAGLLNRDLIAADPQLAHLATLAPNVEWMNGVQFYLTRDVPTAHGHVIHIDTEWALTSISQLQFWRSVAPDQFGDSAVRAILSVDVSDWTQPGSDGRSAMQCSREEVVAETWSQLKRSMNAAGEVLRDDDLHSWFLDADIRPDPARPGYLRNTEPLLVNLVNTWALRPDAGTAIPNLFLASDYVRTHTDLATMEGANEAARRAVNALLDAERSASPRCQIWPLHEPEPLAPFRAHDAARLAAGQPWDDSLLNMALQGLQAASPLLAQVGPLLTHVAPVITPALDAMDASDGLITSAPDRAAKRAPAGMPVGGRLADPTIKAGSVYVPTPQYLDVDLADRLPGAGNLVGPAGFTERLAWYREMVTDTLTNAVPAHEPQHHLYALVQDFMSRSGKGLRPALCLATTRALGGQAHNALKPAAGLELLHNAFLVHDDIEDGSDLRRGVPTMHRSAGTPIAINTGDAMNALAMRLFRDSGTQLGPQTALRILDEVDHLLLETLEGQALELGWVRDNYLAKELDMSADDYLRLVLKKTAWYSFIHPLRIGALAANGKDPNLGRFDRFGFLLGLAFQITDDVLNLKGNEAQYGKEIGGDLWEGKRTLVLAHGLSQAPRNDRDWIGQFLSRPRERRLPREVQRLQQILVAAGSLSWAEQSAQAFASAAALEFDRTAFAGVAPSADLDWLRGCVDYLVQRQV